MTRSVTLRGVTPHTSEQPFALQQMAPKKRRCIPFAIAGLVVALAAGGYAAYALTRTEAEPGAITACRDAVRQQLKTPATAAFTEDRITEQSGATAYVRGVVDADNEFGATLRKRYQCIANQSGGRWTVVDLSLLPWP